MVEINSLVPDFSLMGSDDKEHKLSQYKGKKVILYFYPRDNTPGCSTEACDFRDNTTNFTDKNAIVIGISRDSLKSHAKFIEKFNMIPEENLFNGRNLSMELCIESDLKTIGLKDENIYLPEYIPT